MTERVFKYSCGFYIPKDWETSDLLSLTSKIGSGATPTGGEASYKTEGISLVRSLNVHNNTFIYDKLAHINEAQAKELENVTLEKEDVLINITGASVARSCIVPNDILPARVNQHVAILRANKEKLNPLYLNLLLTSPLFQKILLTLSKGNGGTREALTKKLLQDFVIILPATIDEQKQIATALSDVDDLISTLQNLIEKKRNIKQGVMQELLSGERRLSGFTDEWKEDSLSNHFTNGSTNGAIVKWRASSYPKPGLFKAFSASGQDVWVDYKMYNCDAIVISAVGEHCGKCFLAMGEWSVVANTHILLGDKYQYMPYWIYIFDNENFWQRGGSGQPFVQVKATLKKTMLIPSYEEQKAIAQVLSDIDSEISILEKRLEKYKALKQGMMQQLLTGKIRLI